MRIATVPGIALGLFLAWAARAQIAPPPVNSASSAPLAAGEVTGNAALLAQQAQIAQLQGLVYALFAYQALANANQANTDQAQGFDASAYFTNGASLFTVPPGTSWFTNGADILSTPLGVVATEADAQAPIVATEAGADAGGEAEVPPLPFEAGPEPLLAMAPEAEVVSAGVDAGALPLENNAGDAEAVRALPPSAGVSPPSAGVPPPVPIPAPPVSPSSSGVSTPRVGHWAALLVSVGVLAVALLIGLVTQRARERRA